MSMQIKDYFEKGAAYCIALLFVYSAVSKILEFEEFQAQLGQSPLTSIYAGYISYALIAIELIIAFLVCLPRYRRTALKGASFLMLLFTAYIVAILNFSDTIPCSCGGIIEQFDWKSHLWFNVSIESILITTIVTQSKSLTKAILQVVVQVLSSAAIIAILYFTAENALHNENPFVRRFITGTATKITGIKLQNNTLYFAGAGNHTLYLGDTRAPLHVISYDTLLRNKQVHKIELDLENFEFKTVQVQLIPPHFYVMDGTIPVVYKGNTINWKAKMAVAQEGYYFSKAMIVDSSQMIFRTQQGHSGENALGLLHFSKPAKAKLDTTLLQKQIDGFFDTDGILNYDASNKTFVYLYYYRNQFIVTNSNVKLRYRGNTIDTTTRAKIVPTYISKTKQRKLASTSNPVNKISTIHNHKLFVNSTLRGKFEPKEMWDIASIIDVYDIGTNQYLSSFYIYSTREAPLKEITVVGNTLYAIVGNELHKYKLKKF